MKLHGDVTINKRKYRKGEDVAWYMIYPFFLLHMLAFGGSGFFMAYADQRPDLSFLYMHGGLAILVYTIFYLAIFGLDEVKWMFINALLGLFGIYSQIGFILSLFGKKAGDFPLHVHAIPFLYFVLYTFLLRHAVLDIMRVGDDEIRKKRVETVYVIVSVVVYGALFLLT